MKISKKGLSTLGLVFITFLAAIQYVFLKNIPESVSTFSFICITNIIGMSVVFITRFKKVIAIKKKTVLKGAVFAVLLTGFNLFVLLGSKGVDSVVISSMVSLYFVFITPLLLLLRKKVNFFSSIATVLAIIALILMFGGNVDGLFQSTRVLYLVIADVFFATYVVGVSILGEGEDSSLLAFSQMFFSVILSFAGWIIESVNKGVSLSLPSDMRFWINAVFIGVFIRAVYGLIQISCQKHVSAISASLIFSLEIIITIIMDPIMCRILNTQHTPATVYQITGAVFLVIATLVVDDNIMGKLGYAGMNEPSVTKKMVTNTLAFSMITLVFSTIISLSAIYFIRNSAISGSSKLGEEASNISSGAMIEELEERIVLQVEDKAKLAKQKLASYSSSVEYAAAYAESLYRYPDEFPKREVSLAKEENAGKWSMQIGYANRSVDYDQLKTESRLLGNMEDVFAPIVQDVDNVLSIYISTESGLLISYDKYSQLAAGEGNEYYEFRDSEWYKLGKSSESAVFTGTYWDGYGRGLTITCVAPIFDDNGNFVGCVAMDVLMKDINESMVNDGIIAPNSATLIDNEGNLIASKDLDMDSEESFNIFDNGRDESLKDAGRVILEKKNGVINIGEGDDEVYISFAEIDSTGWILCIKSPVSMVLEPSYRIKDNIESNTESVVSSVLQGVLTVIQNILVLTAFILLVVTLTAGLFSKRITEPLKMLTQDVKEISGGNLDRRTEINTDDEIGELARSFNHMNDSLQKYISDLKDVTAKEERIASELAVARNIQENMLPTNFSDFSVERGGELYAMMTPAKEVGGDFYDFFMTDDDHLALVMADVSGKGIPAALFMMISKSMIKNCVQLGKSPAETLSDVNMRLMENNKARQFVTVWLAVIDLSTGKGVAANAGHEHPVIRRAGGLYELVEYKHSAPVATMKKTKFREHEFELHPGDSLFVYTDGVAEATNKDNVLLGTERMLDYLNKKADASPQETLSNVMEGINTFVAGAEQFDDITMLCFKYIGTTSK